MYSQPNFSCSLPLEERLNQAQFLIVILSVASTGLFGNILALYSINRQRAKSTFNQSLTALAISDILFLSVVIVDSVPNIRTSDMGLAFPFFWHPLRTMLISFEAFLMMSISTERFLAVFKPIQYKSYKMSQSPAIHFTIFIVPTVLISFAINIPKFLEFEAKFQNEAVSANETIEVLVIEMSSLRLDPDYIFYYTHLARLICTGVVPMIFLTATNLAIWRVITQDTKMQSQNSVKVPRKSSFALFSIVILFISCNIPRLMLNQAEWKFQATLYKGDECVTKGELSWLDVLSKCSLICLSFNSSANFLLYYSIHRLVKN